MDLDFQKLQMVDLNNSHTIVVEQWLMMDGLALNKYNFKDNYFISYLLEKIEVQNNWIV